MRTRGGSDKAGKRGDGEAEEEEEEEQARDVVAVSGRSKVKHSGGGGGKHRDVDGDGDGGSGSHGMLAAVFRYLRSPQPSHDECRSLLSHNEYVTCMHLCQRCVPANHGGVRFGPVPA